MVRTFYLLGVLAVLGAADTLYFHEWRVRLPGMGRRARAELQLHALRDFVYSVLFGSLPWFAWQGWWAAVLALLLLTEVVLTLWDFVVEDWIRKPLGGVYPGERIMHGVMGITYGAMLAYLGPSLRNWWFTPTQLVISPVPVPSGLRWTMLVLAAGVLLSGVRDLCAAAELPGSAWPWVRR
ncbi:MAG: hypothetical protein DMG71_04680 [Acidobacteria bacterium]|nr:MAG: hypothetical protein DMG71_04680 [Acidobacteriota bacterium]